MSDIRWLDRTPAPRLPYMTLVLSPEEFEQAKTHLKVTDHIPWVNLGADATTHWWFNDDGDHVAVVSLSVPSGKDGTEIAGLLVHEAVHIWQCYVGDILREKSPGDEQEAYGIQWISQVLMSEYARRLSDE